LADAVLRYLSEHPQASDTLDGIAEWWMGSQEVRVDRSILSDALHDLAERGFLEEIWSPGGVRFRLRDDWLRSPEHV
jgi:hypothetical protein